MAVKKMRNKKTGQIIEIDLPDEVINSNDTTGLASELDKIGFAQQEIETTEKHENKLEENKRFSEVVFPRTAKAARSGSVFKTFLGMNMDLASSVFTAPAAYGRTLDTKQPYLKSYQQISEGKNPQGDPNLVSSIVSDPATLPMTLSGMGTAKWILKGGKWLPTTIKSVLVGSGEGAASGVIHEAEKAVEGGEFEGKGVLKEAAIGGMIPGGIGAVSGVAKLGNVALGKLASQLSNVSEEALRKWGMGVGKGSRELKDIYGKQKEIGDKLLDALENFEKYTPEKQVVDEALKQMPNIKTDKVVKYLEGAIDNFPMKNTNKASVTSLKNVLSDLKESGGDLTATQFKELRRQIDDIVDWNAPGAKKLNNVLKSVRKEMKDELIDAAEKTMNPDYKVAMKSWADKLQKRDALLEEIGASSKVRNRRVGQFLSTLFNKNKEVRQRALENMTDIFGEDFVKQAKLLQMSDEIISPMSGGAKVLPNLSTGKGSTSFIPGGAQIAAGLQFGQPNLIASGVATAGAASPVIASKALKTLDVVDAVMGAKGLSNQEGRSVASIIGRKSQKNKEDK